MHPASVKDRFVELRAQGKSFVSIAEEIEVSKPTLIEWSREMHEQIRNLRAINDEALREKYRLTKHHELEILSRQLEAVEKEIEQRALADISTDKLYGVLFKLMGEAREERKPVTLQHTHDSLDFLDIATTKTWEA
ncbi:MAG: hypothetical protein AAB668_01235 [Patescibacteria group bacterium]